MLILAHLLRDKERDNFKKDFEVKTKDIMKNNVIGMESAKSELELKRNETKFKSYLSALKQEELQTEANFIMNSMGKDLDDFGLAASSIRVRFNSVEYRLGKLNPVNHQRYILLNDKILMVNEAVYELLQLGVDGFKDKN